MIPTSYVTETVTEQAKNKTYRLDRQRGRIWGRCDGLESVRQSVWKILSTPKSGYLIYGNGYGLDREAIAQADPERMETVARQEVERALLADGRITGVEQVSAARSGDSLHLAVRAHCLYGTVQVTTEV